MQSTKVTSKSVISFRDVCPLVQYGAFGLKASHDLPRLCSRTDETRILYGHFTQVHRLKSSVAYRLVKAMCNGEDPKTTKIFPQDNTSALTEKIICPFNTKNAEKLREHGNIPNSPCAKTFSYHVLKEHLRTEHSITARNAELIYCDMKFSGTIHHIRFDGNLCDRN